MSREIDERVVQMEFDNRKFEDNVHTSLGTLDKLKAALNFGDSVKEMDNLEKAGRSFSLAGMGDAVDFVGSKFSALEVIGLRVLQNLTDSAYRMGKNFIKSVSVDQISAGWSKYGEKTNAVASLISQGKWDMEEIDAQLERLNWFTDETSYNFTDMTKEIGKFTAAGKGLDESVNAMEGIAMWAALSGQNANTASRAMYQISQAMGAGVMRKEDYKSIQNAAMDTEEFRQKALDAGVAAGTLKKNVDGTYTSIVKGAKSATFSISQFADNLTQTQWFNDEVMMDVFGQYGAAVDQIYAYAEEHNVTASEAIEALGDKVDAFGLKAFRSAQEARTFSDVVDSVKDAVSTGWMNSFEQIFGNYEEAKELWTDLANEMYDVFAGGAEARNDMLKEWKKDGGRDALINSFWNTWNSVLDIINLVKDAFHDIFPAMDAERLLDITKRIESFTESVRNYLNPKQYDWSNNPLAKKGLVSEEMVGRMTAAESRMENLSKTFKGFFAILDIGKQALGAVFDIFKRLVVAVLPGFDYFLESTGSLGQWLTDLAEASREMDFFGQIVESITPVINAFGKALRWVFEHISKGVSYFTDMFAPFRKEVNETAETAKTKINPIAKAIDIVVGAFRKLKEIAMTVWNGGLKDIFSSLGESIGGFFKNLKEAAGQEGGIKNVIDILTGGLFAGSLIGKNALQGSFRKLIDMITGSPTTAIGKAKEAISGFMDTILDKFLGVQKMDIGNTMLKFAASLGILALAIFLLSSIKTETLMGIVAAIGALAFIFVKVRDSIISKTKKTSLMDTVTGFIDDTLKAFSPKKHGQMLQMIELGVVLLLFAAAIAEVAKAVATIATLDIGQLIVGLVGVAALMAMMVIVAKQLSKLDNPIAGGGKTLKAMATAVGILAASVKVLGEMELGKLIAGTIAVGVLVGACTLFAKFAGKVNIGTGVALIALAGALVIMSYAVKQLGGMEVESLGRGLIGIAGILAAIAAFSALVDWKKLLGISVGMVVMSAAITVISGAVKLLSTISGPEMLVAVSGLSAMLIVLGIIANLLSGTLGGSLSLVILSAGIALLAGSLMLLSLIPMDRMKTALFGLAAGLAVLVIGASLLAPACESIGFGMLGVALALAAITAAIAMLDTITVMSQASIFNGIKAIAEGILDVLLNLAPKLVQTGLTLLYNLADGFVQNFPIIVEKGIAIVTTLVDGIVAAMPVLVQAAFDLTVSFINAVADGIDENSDAIWGALKRLFGAIIKFILDGIDSILGWIPGVTGALDDAKKWVDENFSSEEMKKETKDTMSGTKEGIEAATPEAKEAMAKYYHEVFKEDGTFDFERAKQIAEEHGIDIAQWFPNSVQQEAEKHEGEVGDVLSGQYDEYVAALHRKNAEAKPLSEAEFNDYQAYLESMLSNGASQKDVANKADDFVYKAIEKPLVDAGTDAKEAGEEAAKAIPGALEVAAGPTQADKTALYKAYSNFGGYAVDGFEAGVKAKMGKLGGISKQLRSMVGDDTAKEFEEKSPSKLMFRIGAYAIQGMLNGIVSLKEKLAKASTETTREAIDPITDGFTSLQTLLDEGLDADPTIRPVLDLSEIQNGMTTIDDLFGTKSLGVASRIRGLRTQGDLLSDRMNSLMDRKFESLDSRLSTLEDNKVYKFDIHTEVDGRQIARSTAIYNKEELDKISKRANRKVGVL